MIIYVIGINMFNIENTLIKDIVTVVLVSFATIMTIVSGIDYFIKNAKVLKEQK